MASTNDRVTSKPSCVKCGEPTGYSRFWPGEFFFNGHLHDHCEDCRYDIIRKSWGEAKSWGQLVTYNKAFLDGDDFCTPYHPVPTDPETVHLLPGLKRLHEYGAITTISQPFEHTIGKFPDTDKWLERKQRPYVAFAIPTVHQDISRASIQALISQLLSLESIVTTVHSECHVYPRDPDGSHEHYRLAQHVAPIGVKNDNKYSADKTHFETIYDFRASVVQSGSDHPFFTKERTAATESALADATYELITHFGFSRVDKFPADTHCTLGEKISSAIFDAMPLFIEVATKDWDEDMDLLGLLEEQFKIAGLKRVYPELNQS